MEDSRKQAEEVINALKEKVGVELSALTSMITTVFIKVFDEGGISTEETINYAWGFITGEAQAQVDPELLAKTMKKIEQGAAKAAKPPGTTVH